PQPSPPVSTAATTCAPIVETEPRRGPLEPCAPLMSLSVPIGLAGPEASVVPLGNASLIALIRLRKCSRCGGFPTARPGERREFDAGVPTASRAERIGARGRRDAAARCSSEGVDETARHGDDAL